MFGFPGQAGMLHVICLHYKNKASTGKREQLHAFCNVNCLSHDEPPSWLMGEKGRKGRERDRGNFSPRILPK